MNARKGIAVGLKTIALAIALTIIFMLGAMISGIARSTPSAPATTTAAQVGAPGQAGNVLLLLFAASLVQAIVVTYLALEARWNGWKLAGALFLVIVNMWLQSGIESLPYLRSRLAPTAAGRLSWGS